MIDFDNDLKTKDEPSFKLRLWNIGTNEEEELEYGAVGGGTITGWQLSVHQYGEVVLQQLRKGYDLLGRRITDVAYGDVGCEEKNITHESLGSEITKTIKIDSIKLKLEDEKCRKGFNYVECKNKSSKKKRLLEKNYSK